jgi:hypothetical protein
VTWWDSVKNIINKKNILERAIFYLFTRLQNMAKTISSKGQKHLLITGSCFLFFSVLHHVFSCLKPKMIIKCWFLLVR